MKKPLRITALAYFKVFFRRYPEKTLAVLCAQVVAGLADTLSIASVLPILHIFSGGESETNPMSRLFDSTFSFFGGEPTLGILLLLIVILVFGKNIVDGLARYISSKIVAQISADLRQDLLSVISKANWRHYITLPVGEVSNALANESGRAAGMYGSLLSLIYATVNLLLLLIVMSLISWEVAFAGIVIGSVTALGMASFVSRSRGYGNEMQKNYQSMVRRIADLLQNMKAIKAMAQEEKLSPVLSRYNFILYSNIVKSAVAKILLMNVREPIAIVFICAGIYFAVAVYGIPFAELIVVALLFHRGLNAAGTLQIRYQEVAVAEGFYTSYRRTVDSMAAQKEILEPLSHALNVHSDRSPDQSIQLSNVSFSYKSTSVLTNLSCQIPLGQVTVVMGPSGRGKTTLIDLICGLLVPDSGEITVDGQTLREIGLSRWRSSIGYVSQDTVLFHDSIKNNIGLYNDSISDEAVSAAISRAELESVIGGLPDGINTVVGERGIKLSGGQRQRIAIARAVVRSPRLLILDEATTALDPETESKVLANLAAMTPDTSIVAISHQKGVLEIAKHFINL